MDATTTRASTVSRSMPTRETRTQASITMPLSRTRSKTSMRLVPPEARSTGMLLPPAVRLFFRSLRSGPRRRTLGCQRQRGDSFFQRPHLVAQNFVLGRQMPGGHGKIGILAPPVQTDLLRLVDRADEEADADGDELDLRQGDPDVAGNDQP